ncbi:MAG: hypothetical protein ACRCZF_04260, partial [Gemmataceae bacterium]
MKNTLKNWLPRLQLTALEDRTTPATFTVNSAADTGATGTLRWAIGQANANTDMDDIVITTPDVISLGSDLPEIKSAVNIFGQGMTTQVDGNGKQMFVVRNTTNAANFDVTFNEMTFGNGTAAKGGGL